MTAEEVFELGDEVLNEAITPPESCELAIELFKFYYSNIRSCVIPNLNAIIVDKDKLEKLAERRGIELVRYDAITNKFIEEYIKWQTRQSPSD